MPWTSPLLPEYRVQSEIDAKELLSRSQALYDQARKANMTCDRYTLLTLLCTAAPFLSGLVSGFEHRRMGRMLLALSFTVLLVAALMLARLPVAVLA